MKKTIDCRGIACPMPVIMAKKELENEEKITLEVNVDNIEAKENLTRLAKSMNLEVEYVENSKDDILVRIIKTGKEEKKNQKDEKMTILIKSRNLGIGDEKMYEDGEDVLGGNLMKTFIYSLTESHPYPKKIMFVNTGVYLTTKNEETIKNLKLLEEGGTEILSCGICLNYYNLKEKLAVGQIGNMYDIVDSLNQSLNKIIL